MKTKKLFLGLFAFSFLLMSGGKVDRMDSDAQIVKSNIESRNYEIEVDKAHPIGMRNINLTSDYSVKIKGDSIYSHLPYYGRAYSIPYGGGEGLIFDSKITDYEATAGRKGATEIVFKTRSKEDIHIFSISIHSNGSAFITVSSNNRQTISFSGEMELD